MSSRGDDGFDDLFDALIVAAADYQAQAWRRCRLGLEPYSADRHIQTQDAVLAAAEALVHRAGTCGHCTRWVPVLDMPWHTDTPTAGPG